MNKLSVMTAVLAVCFAVVSCLISSCSDNGTNLADYISEVDKLPQDPWESVEGGGKIISTAEEFANYCGGYSVADKNMHAVLYFDGISSDIYHNYYITNNTRKNNQTQEEKFDCTYFTLNLSKEKAPASNEGVIILFKIKNLGLKNGDKLDGSKITLSKNGDAQISGYEEACDILYNGRIFASVYSFNGETMGYNSIDSLLSGIEFYNNLYCV